MVLIVARRRSRGSAGLVLGVVLLIGLALLVIKWLFFTALILAVPFGLWWLHDRRSRTTRAGSARSASGNRPRS